MSCIVSTYILLIVRMVPCQHLLHQCFMCAAGVPVLQFLIVGFADKVLKCMSNPKVGCIGWISISLVLDGP